MRLVAVGFDSDMMESNLVDELFASGLAAAADSNFPKEISRSQLSRLPGELFDLHVSPHR